MARLAAIFALLVVSGGCGRGGHEEKPAPPKVALTVEFAGCEVVHRGPVCAVTADTTLHLWVKTGEGAAHRVTIDGSAVAIDERPEQGGTSIALRPPKGAKKLEVVATLGEGTASYALPLEAPPDWSALAEVETLKKAGSFADAEAKAKPFLDDARPEVKARATGLYARTLLAEGKTEEAIASLKNAVTLDREAQLVSAEVEDTCVEVWAEVAITRDFVAARQHLDGIASVSATSSSFEAWVGYHRGLLAYDTGDLRGALATEREAAARSERLGIDATRAAAVEVEGLSLQRLGRHAEASAALASLDAIYATQDACKRGSHLNNAGFLRVQQMEGEPHADERDRAREAVGYLDRAVVIFSGDCQRPSDRADALTNVALAEFIAGDTASATEKLAEARAAVKQARPETTASWLDLAGRIALADKRPRDARVAFDRLEKLAASSLLFEDEWQASVGLGETAVALHDDAAAARAFDAAERILDEHVLAAPVGEGRGTFLGRFERGARAHVAFLASRGDAAGVAKVARTNRARALVALRKIDRLSALSASERAAWDAALADYRRAFDAVDAQSKNDWQLPADKLDAVLAERKAKSDAARAALEKALAVLGPVAAPSELAAPRPGELFLIFHPSTKGWVGVAEDASGAELADLGDVDVKQPEAALATELLAPFAAKIDDAKSIRVMAYGDLERVDFHALPWKGEPLVAKVAVAYGADVPSAPKPFVVKRALVVGDPRGDLPAAGMEAEAIETALRERHVDVKRIEQKNASRREVLAAIEGGVDLFHYAGHGVARGADGWDSTLLLADGDTLSVSDILALAHAPARVVLSGCDTATTDANARVEGLGVAQAFLLAGASEVVASTKPVDDRATKQLMDAFYRVPGAASSALRRADLALEARDEPWSSFRVLVP